MIITRANTLPSTDADERPWYDLIDEVPEPPEDGMQQDDTITAVKSILSARYANDPSALVAGAVHQCHIRLAQARLIRRARLLCRVRRGHQEHKARPTQLPHR